MQVIYSGGELSGSVRMAKLNADMARLNLEESRQQVKFLLLGWLIDLQCIHNRIRVLDENIGLARSVLDNVRARNDEGGGPEERHHSIRTSARGIEAPAGEGRRDHAHHKLPAGQRPRLPDW